MLTCVTGMVLAGATLIIRGWSTFRNDMVQSLSTQAEMIAENCKASLVFQDAQDAEKTLGALHVEPSIVFGCIYTKDKKIFATYYRGYAEIKVHPPKFQENEFVFGKGLLTVFRPIVLEGEVIGTVCLRSDMSPMYTMLKHNAGAILAILFLSSSAAFFVLSRLQNVISRPILSLAEVAKAVSEKRDYSARAIKQSNDEVGLLIDAFNEMLGQIQHRDVELVDAKEKLEVRVEERTAELKTTNEQLTQEVVVRQKAEEVLKKRTDQAILYRDILLRLAKIKKDDLASSLETITEEDSRALGVERVGIWFFDDERIEIVCKELYKQSENIHKRGLTLKAKDYPKYFQSLDESRIIAASDARTDYRTNEFTKGYLEPTGITSMMDVPLWLHGRIVGVIRHGHTGPKRTWTTEEQDFAASIADMVSLTLEASERKKAEEQLRSAEEKYRMQFEGALDAIFVADAETGILIDCNPAATRLVGREKSELVGQHQRILHPPEKINGEFSETFKKHLEEKPGQTLETQVITKTGELREVAIKASPLEIGGKKILQGIFHDITIRKKAEHKLQESEKRFQEIVGNASEWVWEVDANGLYTYSSPVIEELLGYKPEEVVGKKHFYDLLVAEDRDEVKRLALEKFAEKQAFKGFLNANVHKNGQTAWLMVSGVPILDDAGNLVGYRGSDIDITLQKQAEEIMKRLNKDLEITIAKLGRANNELKDFVYIASHDLREPLRKISAFGELLSASLKDKLNDDDKENFGFMVDGAKRMQQMIDALLTYSRVTTKGVDFEAVDLNKVVEELRSVELAVKIEETGAK